MSLVKISQDIAGSKEETEQVSDDFGYKMAKVCEPMSLTDYLVVKQGSPVKKLGVLDSQIPVCVIIVNEGV